MDKFDDDMQQLDRNARDLEIRGNRNSTSANILSLESPASPAPYKSHAVDSSADWRASPFAASLDDEEAALWDRLTLEQLEVLQGLYTTHTKVLHQPPPVAAAPLCIRSSLTSRAGPQRSHAAPKTLEAS